jgi:hypothetical protein
MDRVHPVIEARLNHTKAKADWWIYRVCVTGTQTSCNPKTSRYWEGTSYLVLLAAGMGMP